MRQLRFAHVGLCAAGLALAAPAASQYLGSAGPALVDVRADPAVADAVNEVLARYAQPATTAVPPGEDLAAYLKRTCGGAEVAVLAAEPAPKGLTRVRHAPCVRIDGPKVVEVEDGLTLTDIALRYGLRADRAASFAIEGGPRNQGRRVTAKTLQPGDEVTIPARPQWTQVRLNPNQASGAKALTAALADALGCRGDAQACLNARGVSVLERSTPSAQPLVPLEPTANTGSRHEAEFDRVEESAANAMDAVAETASENNRMAAPAPPPAVYAVAPYAAAAAAAEVPAAIPMAAPVRTPVAVGVDPEQWPFDHALVTELLRLSASHRDAVRIGIADIGLADLAGAPLAGLLARNGREEGDAEERSDDDGNDYVDDVLGAGPRRDGDGYDYLDDRVKGNGQLNVCVDPAGVAALGGDRIWLANHGPMVGSLASGAAIAAPADRPGLNLPHLVFYRLAVGSCAGPEIGNFSNGDLNAALEYLLEMRDSDVVNVSFKMRSDSNTRALFRFVADALNNSTDMLVVAAGNGNGDLDQEEICPACLGNAAFGATYGAPELHKRVLAVGSAEPTLRTSPGTNVGRTTVRFYAPGTPSGLDYRGQTVTGSAEGSTSFAAPRATFAVALLKSFGITKWGSVVARLTAASWPRVASDGSPQFDAPVIDLTKVAAVDYDVVEVTIPKDGTFYRHSYVGKIEGKVADIAICQGIPFQRQNFHSIRLGSVSDSGTRKVIADRYRNGDAFPPPLSKDTCRSSGDITLVGIDGVRRQFPLTSVNSILLEWLE